MEAELCSTRERKKLFVKTFGCQMNEYDSEKVALLLSETCEPVSELEEADVVFVNTCSVREKGEHKLFSLLGRVRDLKREKPELILGVGGCVAQQEGMEIIKRNHAVDFVVGTHNLSLIPSMVAAASRGRRKQVAIDYRDDWEELPEAFLPAGPAVEEDSLFGVTSPVRALVSIQRGCNKHCSYCVVPNTRGEEVSRPLQEILREARIKVQAGAKEVLLLGQTVNSYGKDLAPRVRFEDLIRELAAIDGVERIRFTSPHPQDVRTGFLDLYADVPQLVPHIHLPLQSGSDRVLKLMNRNYRVGRYLDIVDGLRERVPDIAITSDMIVGFPTETAAEFEATLEVMERVRYHATYSFVYSRRPHTPAETAFRPDQELPLQEAKKRLQQLQALQDEHSLAINQQQLGKQAQVLVEGKDKKLESFRGRIPQNTPVEVTGGSVALGQLVEVMIRRASPHGLLGEVVS